MTLRQMISAALPETPWGRRAEARAICALSTTVNFSVISLAGQPRATVRVMSVVPLKYCPPLSTSSSEFFSSRALVFSVG